MGDRQKAHKQLRDKTPANHRLESSFMRPISSGQSLEPDVRSVLEPRFGHNLENIRIFSDAQSGNLSENLDAAAFTVGQDIFFSNGLYNPSSRDGMHLLAHEVAHAVQQRNATSTSGELRVSDRLSSLETEAHSATDAIMNGESFSLGASSDLAISRWESGEHKRAMDEALKNMGPGAQIDPAVAAQMGAKIKLANGLEVTPGQITAMMGDLYGKFSKGADGKDHFDPKASFDQMNNADPKEMQKLIGIIDREADDPDHKPAKPSEFEDITRNRGEGESYLELAEKNNSHFSGASNTGTDNNMGTYSAFHKMALDAAQKGDPESMNMARALEASSMHYLTDRFSGGHNFDKDAVMKASGQTDGLVPWANLAVKSVHDHYNENGMPVSDAQGSQWSALGDNHWENKDDKGDPNAENRRRTSQAVYGSWDELEKVKSGQSSANDLEKSGYGALSKVPQWDARNEAQAEAIASHTSKADIIWDYGKTLPNVAKAKALRYYGKAENAVGEAWDWTKQKAGDALDWTKDKANKAWDWTKNTASDAADWVGDKANTAWDAAGDAVDWAGDKANKAADWVGDKAQGAWNAAGKATDWVGDKAEGALDAVGDAASWAGKKLNPLNWF